MRVGRVSVLRYVAAAAVVEDEAAGWAAGEDGH